jgi:maltose alpha-D-glucosyltransferase/alpha-amylase
VHGDYHLGQVLVAENDFFIIDFEGEPSRPLEERRQKSSPYKDAAGMIRSFDYAVMSITRKLHPLINSDRPQNSELLNGWRKAATESFLKGYSEKGQIDNETLHFFLLEKALYEIVYETQHRPDWVDIPLEGVLRLLEDKTV